MLAESAHPTALAISRAQTLWLAVAFLAGAVLRLGTVSSVAVEHFDEAVYASNLLFTLEEGSEFPMRQLYAPALLPAAIEWTTIIGQTILGDVPNWWPMLPALLAGLVTIPSAWWIVRQWFGPPAGIAAALLIACDEFHASYSRTALTDIPLSLFVLWAVYWFWRALQSGERRQALFAGAFTALAWWTKYNGWLPLAIAAAGGTLWQISLPRQARNWTKFARTWVLAAVTAALLWSPVLWDCRKVGGYGQVAENHRSYITGLSRWIPNVVRGFENLDEFLGGITLAGAGIALAACFLPIRVRPPDTRSNPESSSRTLAACLINAWFWGLVLATPMYYPYSRLWLPCWLAGQISLAALLAHPRFGPLRSPAGIASAGLCLAGALCGLVAVTSVFTAQSPSEPPSCFERRDGFWQVSQQIRETVNESQALLVVGESDPALWHHLRRQRTLALMQSSFGFADARPSVTVYVILGPLSQRMENLQREWTKQAHRFELVEEFACHPSRVTLLDLDSPRDLAANPQLRDPTVRLYRLRR